MANSQHYKTDKEKAKCKYNLAKNKIRKINRELKTASGKHAEMLKNRLEFWEDQR